MIGFLERIMGTLRYEALELPVYASKANIVMCFAFSFSYVTTALNAMPLFFFWKPLNLEL
jgi:hypothetical protein